MKKMLIEKKDMMLKFIVNQIALSLLGVFVSLSVGQVSTRLLLLAGLFSTAFFFFLIYSAVYEDGQKDALKIEGGRMKKNPLLGLYYTVIAYSPTMLLVLLNALMKSIRFANDVFFFIDSIVLRIFTMGMYLGIDAYLKESFPFFRFLSEHGLIFAICLLFAPIVCAAAYYCGVNNIRLTKKRTIAGE